MAFEIWDDSLSGTRNWIRGIYYFFKIKSNLKREHATASETYTRLHLWKDLHAPVDGVSATFWKGPTGFLESWILKMCASILACSALAFLRSSFIPWISIQSSTSWNWRTSSEKKSNLPTTTFQSSVFDPRPCMLQSAQFQDLQRIRIFHVDPLWVFSASERKAANKSPSVSSSAPHHGWPWAVPLCNKNWTKIYSIPLYPLSTTSSQKLQET